MLKKIIALVRNFIKSIDVINNLDAEISYKIRSNLLFNAVLTSNEPMTQALGNEDTELIVSFTTYSKRVHDIHLVVESIAQQTLKPHRIILWLDEEEFTLETIPLILQRQIERGLEVRFCPNYRSYKKLIPSLQAFPDANIITIDDDILYPHDMVELLLKEHKLQPRCIVGHRAHKMQKDSNGRLLPYNKWEYEALESKPSAFVFITSGAGTLFPPQCFSQEIINSEVFMTLCPNADDIWFKAMSLLNNIQCKKVDDSRIFKEHFLMIQDNQDIGLCHSNSTEFGNDYQLNKVFDKYDLFNKLDGL